MIVVLGISIILLIDYMVYKNRKARFTSNGVISSADLIASLRDHK